MKKILLVIFSIVMVAATFFLESRLNASSETDTAKPIEVIEKGSDAVFKKEGYIYKANSGKTSRMVIVLNKNAVFRLAPETSATIALSAEDAIPRNAEIRIDKGRLWINTINSLLTAEISTPVVTILVPPGVFDAQYGEAEETLLLTALRRSLEIQMLGNKLILPESRQIIIHESKIKNAKDTIAKLRYTKLSKEFPYTEAEEPDLWVLQNKKEDDAFLDRYRKSIIEAIRRRGPALPANGNSLFSRANDFSKRVGNFLTFDSRKKAAKEIAAAFEYLDAALYATISGNSQLVKARLDAFALRTDFMADNEELQHMIYSRAYAYEFAPPADPLFDAKLALRALLRQPQSMKLKLGFFDILDIAASGNSIEVQNRVITRLRQYGSVVITALPTITLASDRSDIFFMSILINDFLNRRPLLLREEFLKISELFERAELSLIGGKEEAEDSRQYLISEKLKKITVIRGLMQKGDADFQDGRRAILLLSRHIEDLKPTFSDTAVSAYFEDQLNALNPFIVFLKSSGAETLRGSFIENFEDFESRIEEMRKVTELLGSATGGTAIPEERREELASLVAADFGGIGITAIKLTLPDQEEDVRVRVTAASFEGKPVTGIYDTGRKVMSDILFDGEKIPNAIRLENLKNFFLVRLGRLVLEPGITAESLTEAPSKESIIEKVAKETLLVELAKLNIIVEEKYLGLESLDEGIVHVRLAAIGQGADAKVFSFDVMQKTSSVSNLKVQTVQGEIPVNDMFALRELPVKVEAIYQRALFEKQKEEELKKFLERGTSTEEIEIMKKL